MEEIQNKLLDSIQTLHNEVYELKEQVKELNKNINNLPEFLPMSLLASETGKSRVALREHLLSNYTPDGEENDENEQENEETYEEEMKIKRTSTCGNYITTIIGLKEAAR